MSDERLYANGIDATGGGYMLPPTSPVDLAAAALGDVLRPDQLEGLQAKWDKIEESFAPADGIDPKNLAEAGWGVIFPVPKDEDAKARHDSVVRALGPLLERRKAQAGELYKEYTGVNARRPDESATRFLGRHGAGPGPVDPTALPYYLLIVADPDTIPFDFQYILDLDYAVGRLHFETVEEFGRYAQSVVAAETTPRPPTKIVTLFGVRNDDDPATAQSADLLVGPLGKAFGDPKKAAGWTFQSLVGEGQATKSALAGLLARGNTARPDLLFTASHGLAYPPNDPMQLRRQGALLCQEWPGPAAWGGQPIPVEFFLCADDLGDSSDVAGLIAFHFACYGAGTPKLDDFPHPKLTARPTIASKSFLAGLPTRMLSHPNGGALAVVGHVERAWPCSFVWKDAGKQVEVFRSMISRLLHGHPIGSALELFNNRYATLSAFVNREVEDARFGGTPNPSDLAYLWTATNDARGYVVLGDPAVRLPAQTA